MQHLDNHLFIAAVAAGGGGIFTLLLVIIGLHFLLIDTQAHSYLLFIATIELELKTSNSLFPSHSNTLA